MLLLTLDKFEHNKPIRPHILPNEISKLKLTY